jgi:signal transduction histidine kinase
LVAADEEPDGSNLARTVNRAAILIVGGTLLAYMGAHRDRSRQRLTQLVAWPGPDRSSGATPANAAALTHVAALLRAPRLLIVWEQPEEPFRHLEYFSYGKVEHSREPAGRFGSLVAPGFEMKTFRVDAGVAGATRSRVDPDLAARFAIGKALSAPFHRDLCQGRVFALDIASSSDDDLPLIELIAHRFGVDLEHYMLREEIHRTAAVEEREWLARDLHDGLLQSLAAAMIQLKLGGTAADPEVRRRLEETRALLAREQRRIRRFVESHRASGDSRRTLALRETAGQWRQALERQWGCRISLQVFPTDLAVSPGLGRHLHNVVSEAVSNAARHGLAAQIQITMTQTDGSLCVSITDDGGGFPGLSGTYHGEQLQGLGVGPVSLCSRTYELGGSLSLETSPGGSRVEVRLPL